MGIQYPDVCPMQLDKDGGYYFRHVAAMTDEALHAKSDIAGQLGWRDREIDRLRAELAAKSKDAERYQWLRQLDNAFDFRKLPRTWSAAHTPEQLDDTIDAAMGEGNGR